MSTWKKIRYRLEWLGLSSLYVVIPLLPRRATHALSCALGSLAFALDKGGRNTAIENLTLVFGEEKDKDEIHQIAKDSYRSFAQTVVDQFWSRRVTQDNHEQLVEVQTEDPELFESVNDTGAIWVTPHYSNFEWLALFMGFQGFQFTIVAQPFKNASLTEVYKKNREVTGHEVIPQRGAIMRLLKNLKRGGHAAFLTDLTILPSKPATVIKCFGRKTCVTAIHTELMKRTGLPVIPAICIPRADGSYIFRGFKAMHFGPDDTQQSIAQACWDVFEPVIRENPAPWLWMYKHWRYLPKGETVTYPSYSNQNNKFDEVCERVGV